MNCNKNLLWNYIGYGSSLSINIFLLPIILQYLSGEELGLWYVFMSVGTFVTMVDFGFSPQIARFVTYAYAGADSLKKSGIVSRCTDYSDGIDRKCCSQIAETWF